MGGSGNAAAGAVMPILSKAFCSSSPAMLTVRRRPRVTSGGGFVVLDDSQNLVFTVDGCGVLGAKGELLLKDCDGEPILSITKKGGIAQALRTRNRWKGYSVDYGGGKRLIFSLTDPKCPMSNAVRVSLEENMKGQGCRGWDFTVDGSFTDRACTIEDYTGNIIAQVGVSEGAGGKDLYRVMVRPGHDQAFIVGVVAVLDNINGESTSC